MPLGRGPQVLPGDGVGVARRRGDEDPQVRPGQERGGQVPVVLDHGVNIWCVHDRQSLGQPLTGPQLELSGRVVRGRARRSIGVYAHA